MSVISLACRENEKRHMSPSCDHTDTDNDCTKTYHFDMLILFEICRSAPAHVSACKAQALSHVATTVARLAYRKWHRRLLLRRSTPSIHCRTNHKTSHSCQVVIIHIITHFVSFLPSLHCTYNRIVVRAIERRCIRTTEHFQQCKTLAKSHFAVVPGRQCNPRSQAGSAVLCTHQHCLHASSTNSASKLRRAQPIWVMSHLSRIPAAFASPQHSSCKKPDCLTFLTLNIMGWGHFYWAQHHNRRLRTI